MVITPYREGPTHTQSNPVTRINPIKNSCKLDVMPVLQKHSRSFRKQEYLELEQCRSIVDSPDLNRTADPESCTEI